MNSCPIPCCHRCQEELFHSSHPRYYPEFSVMTPSIHPPKQHVFQGQLPTDYSRRFHQQIPFNPYWQQPAYPVVASKPPFIPIIPKEGLSKPVPSHEEQVIRITYLDQGSRERENVKPEQTKVIQKLDRETKDRGKLKLTDQEKKQKKKKTVLKQRYPSKIQCLIEEKEVPKQSETPVRLKTEEIHIKELVPKIEQSETSEFSTKEEYAMKREEGLKIEEIQTRASLMKTESEDDEDEDDKKTERGSPLPLCTIYIEEFTDSPSSVDEEEKETLKDKPENSKAQQEIIQDDKPRSMPRDIHQPKEKEPAKIKEMKAPKLDRSEIQPGDLLKEFEYPFSTKDFDRSLDKTLKNRMAAQLSREKKKAYEKYLLEMNDRLENASQQMGEETIDLEKKLNELEDACRLLEEQNVELRKVKERFC